MRILFATNHTYLPQRAGGSESSTHELCISFLKKKHEVAVLAALDLSGKVGICNRVKRRIFCNRKYHEDLSMGYPVYRGDEPVRLGINEVVNHFKPSIAVVQAGKPIKLVQTFLKLEIPTVFYLRDVEFDEMGGELFEHKCLLYVANSKFTAQKVFEKFGIKAFVARPLVYPNRYKTAIERKKVIFVCPYPEKGVEIAFKLAESRPDIPFEFVESWQLSSEMWDSYKNRANSLGNVTLKRRVNDMKDVYNKAKLVIVPSIWDEAWCRVVTEAHINGIPVIASDRGGLPESVGDGGILISGESPDKWVSALTELWDDEIVYQQYVDRAIACSKRAEIDPEKIINNLIAVMDSHITECKKT